MSRTFEAAWFGVCANPECGTGQIKVGERARYQPDPAPLRSVSLVHVTCPAPAPPPKVCPGCQMALPLTGVCDDCG